MRILFVDNTQMKTTRHLVEHWSNKHELLFDSYFNPLKAQNVDLVWVEWCEDISILYSRRSIKNYEIISDNVPYPPKDYSWKSKIVIRPIDIDVYFGHYRGVEWANVNGLAYIAKHIYEKVNKEMFFAERYPNLKTGHVPLGIDMDQFTFRNRSQSHGYNIAYVNHLWSGKNLPMALQYLRRLIDVSGSDKWRLFIVGGYSTEAWLEPYIDHLVKELSIQDNIVRHQRVPDVNKFLDDMDYSLSTSSKEAFSLITGESMAKGIKPIIHRWEGARDIWGDEYTWGTIEEAVAMTLGTYDSNAYREYVSQYSKEKELQRADEFIESL